LIKRDIHDIVADTASRDGVLVEIDRMGPNNLVGHNLRAYIEELEKKMRAAAADLEFETAGRLRDEIRASEANELGLPEGERKAPICGAEQRGQAGDAQDPGTGRARRKWGKWYAWTDIRDFGQQTHDFGISNWPPPPDDVDDKDYAALAEDPLQPMAVRSRKSCAHRSPRRRGAGGSGAGCADQAHAFARGRDHARSPAVREERHSW